MNASEPSSSSLPRSSVCSSAFVRSVADCPMASWRSRMSRLRKSARSDAGNCCEVSPRVREVGRRESLTALASDASWREASSSRWRFFIISAKVKATSWLWFSKTTATSAFLSGGRGTFFTTVIGLRTISLFSLADAFSTGLASVFFATGFAAAFFATGLAAGFFAAGFATGFFAAGFFAAGFAAGFFATGFFAAGFLDFVLMQSSLFRINLKCSDPAAPAPTRAFHRRAVRWT